MSDEKRIDSYKSKRHGLVCVGDIAVFCKHFRYRGAASATIKSIWEKDMFHVNIGFSEESLTIFGDSYGYTGNDSIFEKAIVKVIKPSWKERLTRGI